MFVYIHVYIQTFVRILFDLRSLRFHYILRQNITNIFYTAYFVHFAGSNLLLPFLGTVSFFRCNLRCMHLDLAVDSGGYVCRRVVVSG